MTHQLLFDAWLRGRRAEAKITQDQLAGKLNVSRAKIADWERGATQPIKLTDIRRLAAWAGVTAPDLLPMLDAGRAAV